MKYSLLLPTLNEVEGMTAILPRIRKEWVCEILVVDGGSTDGTVEYAESQGCKVIRQKNPGLPAAYREGAGQAQGEVMITFSPDGNSLPEKIPELIAKMEEGYEMVIVSRYREGAKSEDDTWLTAWGNKIFTGTVNRLFGGHYTDCLVMFRAWKVSLLREVRTDIPARAGYDLYLSIYCAQRGLRTAEIPGDEHHRIGGTEKMNPWLNGMAALGLILREKFFPGRRVEPLIRNGKAERDA